MMGYAVGKVQAGFVKGIIVHLFYYFNYDLCHAKKWDQLLEPAYPETVH